MIYSRWRPDRGGYEYFESTERRGLGDDLPVPRFSAAATTPLGIASTDAGRRPPAALRRVGTGARAKGLVMPLSRDGLLGLGALGVLDSPRGAGLLGLLVGGAVGWWLARRRGRRT